MSEQPKKIAVRYYSKTGNTKKLAEAIAATAGVQAETVNVPVVEADILFLGSAVYAAGIDEQVKIFIQQLDNRIGKVVNFSTAALLPSTYDQVKKLLKSKGIPLDNREFHCRGSFSFLHKGRPNEQDLANVRQFAGGILAD